MHKIKLLFLGASKRVTLLEQFFAAAKILGIGLQVYCCEKKIDFYPVSHLSTILEGPSFSSNRFENWLGNTITNYGIDCVIPNMDSATVALSKFSRDHHTEFKSTLFPVSDFSLCRIMNDKIQADLFFKSNGIPTFENTTGYYPKIYKPINGFGAKGQHVVSNGAENEAIAHILDCDKYILQDYRPGRETSVDIFFDQYSRLVGYVLRDRESVSDGEVMSCTTRHPSEPEKELIDKITSIPGWRGCITLQYIMGADNRLRVVEINPRFGGGATCSVAAGLAMPTYILQQILGIPIEYNPIIKKIKMVRARRDFYYDYQDNID